jgi:hypothetical protein
VGRVFFFTAIAAAWVWLTASLAKEERFRALGVLALVMGMFAVAELLLRHTALDEDARGLIAYLLFGVILGLLPVLLGP